MRKKTYLYLLFFVLFSLTNLSAIAQTINGILTDEQNQPIEYANVVLLTQTDSTFLTGTVSSENGSFVLTIPQQPKSTNYVIQATCIGYKTLRMPARLGENLTIRMESDAQMLGEVVVKADLPVTRLQGNGLVTNIEGSVLEKAGTAQNLLDYIPGVVSQRGSLQVLGRGTPVVYINGRLMRDSSELEQLSADNIKSVEVINNPGARYDASVKAVIRIQTKKALGDGFGFSNRTMATYNKDWDFLEQLNVNYRKGGLDVFGMLFLYKSYWWEEFELLQDTRLENHWEQTMKAEGESTRKVITTDLGMNYVINPNHSVGFKYRHERYPDTKQNGIFSARITENERPFEQTQSLSAVTSQSTTNSLNFYYNGTVNNWNIDFNTDLLWIDSDENSHTNEDIKPQTGESSKRTVTTFSETRNRLYASKLIFSHSLLGGNLAFGGEFSRTNRDTEYRNPEGILNDDISEIKENNASAFAEYGREFGKVQLQAGLRYEHVTFDYFEEAIKQKEQSKKYDNLFPSVSLGTTFGKVQMQLSYTQDISRPSFHSLRSNVFYANHYTYETGNPFLLPSISHNVSLTSVYKWWQLYASYERQEDDVMFTMEPYSDDDPNVGLLKPINIKAYDIAYIRLSASPTIGWWSPRFTLSARKQWLDIESNEGKISLDRPQIVFRWQNSMKLPEGFLINLNGSCYSKYDAGNSRMTKASWGMDASLHKGFLNDRLTLQLNANDIFLTRRNHRTDYFSEIYTMSKNVEPNTRSFSLTLRYRFNQAKNKYKGTGAGDGQKNRL